MRAPARVILLLLSLPLIVLADTLASDWNDFLGPERNGKSQEKIDIGPWGKTGPAVVWHKKIGVSYGAPVVADGRLFMFARHGNMARLTCMESDTGTELWRFEYPTDYEDMYGYNNGPRSCPVVDEEHVYTFGAEGMLHCLRVSDGKLLWKIDTAARFNVVQNRLLKATYSLRKSAALHQELQRTPGHQTANHRRTAPGSSLSTKRQAKWFTKSATN